MAELENKTMNSKFKLGTILIRNRSDNPHGHVVIVVNHKEGFHRDSLNIGVYSIKVGKVFYRSESWLSLYYLEVT